MNGDDGEVQAELSLYKLDITLGHGTFGKVKLAVHTLTGLKVAIKILDRQSICSSQAERGREINIMRKLSHPNIVRLFDVICTPTKVYVVMEYMDSRDLFEYLFVKRLQEDEARQFFQQIISGVEYCHRHMVVHRDLKPENLLLDSKSNVKIADFGLGNTLRDGYLLKTCCGSPNYAAPELLRQQLYAGPEVDVWSCGVILYALLCGRLPFEVDGDNLPGLYAKIKRGVYPVPNVPEGARDLISRILVVDPMQRITIPEIRRHPWFKKKLPLYIAIPSQANQTIEKVDMDVVKHMAEMGFDTVEVVQSLQNHQQNQATVAYSMLLHARSSGHVVHDAERVGTSEEYADELQIYSDSPSSIHNKWTLGVKSQGPAREMMLKVLRVFHGLNVKWKRIGLYNVKCLWSPPPLVSGTEVHCKSAEAIKFEIQLYTASAKLYVIDLQQVSGSPFTFLQICASFRALVA